MRNFGYLCAGYLFLALGASSARGQDATPAGGPVPAAAVAAEPAPAPVAEPAESDTARVLRLSREARRLFKEGQTERALSLLQEAVAAGEQTHLAAEPQAELHAAYGRLLGRADKGDDGIAQLRQATLLVPADVDIRGDLADALLDEEYYDQAITEATAALNLQPSAEQQKDLTDTLKKARRERLKERLSVNASVEVAYDSNILQGTNLQGTEVQTIGGRSTGSATRTAVAARSGATTRGLDATALGSGFATAITNAYNTPTASVSAAGVPISVELGVDGRLAANKQVGLWLGYNFSQLIQTLAGQDAYNLQQHDITLRLESTPRPWLAIDLLAKGSASFSGLSTFTPFQGAIAGTLKFTFKESKRWRTLLSYTHKYAASFASEDSVLNVDSDELSLGQELRYKPVRLRLGYQLHDGRSGVLQSPIDYQVTYANQGPRMNQSGTLALGQYLYSTPLGYLGNRVATKLHADLPAQLKLDFDASYEYRLYDGLYAATFTPATPQLALPMGSLPTSAVAIPGKQRADHVVALGLSIERALPRGFSLALSYAFLDNLSNIANSLDNRSYVKHTVTLGASYEF